MRRAILLAVAVHAAVILFGGLLMIRPKHSKEKEIREVELVEEEKERELEPKETKKVEKIAETEPEQLPDTTVLEEMDKSPAAPALEAVSLADLESALNGNAGGGDFGRGFGFSSGGVVGGTGAPGSEAGLADVMGGGDLDQKPRVLSSVNPILPPAIRKEGGSVTVVLFVDPHGRVERVSVEKSSNPVLEKPSVEAVRKWVFEPGMRGGKKVPFKLRQTIRVGAG